MTTTFGTDENNDIFLNRSKNLAVLSGLPAIVDACQTATKARLTEMVLEIGQGMPFFESVWIGSPNYSLFESYLRKTLSSVSGVQSVASIDLRTQNNILSYTAVITTAFGTGEVNG